MTGTRAIVFFLAAFFLPLNFARAADGATATNLISPLPIAIGQAFQPEDENRFVEVEGTVTFLGSENRETYLEISSEGNSIQITILHGAGVFTDLLLKSRVQVRGICTAVRSSVDGKIIASLQATNANDITILQVPEATWQQYPVVMINALAPTNFAYGFIHLRGKVRSVEPGVAFWLEDETGAVRIGWKPATAELAGSEIGLLCGWRPEGTNMALHAAFYRSIMPSTRRRSLPTLTTTEQIRWLKLDEALRRYPVKVQGTITFLLGPTNGNAGNIQDGTGGIYVWNLIPSPGVTVHAGDFCEIEGDSYPGRFSPGIYCHRLRVLGQGEFPKPLRPTWDELANGSLDAQWVEIEGVVLSNDLEHLEIGTQGGRISCFVSGGNNLENFLNDIVRVRGAVVEDYDDAGHIQGLHLNLPSENFVSVETPRLADPFSLPTKQIKDLLFYDPRESAFRREKVTGQIIGGRNGMFYLMNGDNGLRLLPQKNIQLTNGEMVEAVGFPQIDNSTPTPLLTLREAVVRSTGRQPLPPAKKISASELLDSQRDSTRVRVDANLVRMGVYAGNQVLELQTDARTFFARMSTDAGRLSQLPAGCRLELTGVYVFNNGRLNEPVQTGPFELLLNSPADVRVLALPSWWTAQHAAMVVGGMALVILLGVFWIAILHQQVNRRTIQLSNANRSLQDEISERRRMENELVRARTQHLIEQERTRIARDIHDELGCNLSQIRLLSEMTLSQNQVSSEIQDNTGKISAKALETTRILDEIVWAVDPQNDTLESLLNYLFSFASDYLALAGIRFRIDAPMKIPHHTLTTQVRHQFYMAVKEMFANIVKHSRATEVKLRLRLENDLANFEIEDNGCGFKLNSDEMNPNASGLNNLRKRFQEIGGKFDLQSEPDRGTRIQFTLPLKEMIK
jgi:signal transduction histidine kinase